MKRSTIQTILFGGFLAGALSAQTPKPVKPAGSSPPSAGTSNASQPAGSPAAAPVNSAITAPPDPAKVVLEINGDKMTAGQFDEMVKALGPQVQQAVKGPKRHEFVDQYIQLRLAAKEAERLNLQSKPAIKEQIALQRENVLAGALYQDMMASVKISDSDIQKYYDEHKSDYETAKAEHILIRFKGSPVPLGKDKKDLTEEEALTKAKDIQKRLMAGEDFAKLQKENTDDTSGSLPPFSHGQMVKEFDQAAFTLPIGKISDPVKTQFGYHIIKVISRDNKTLEQAKPEIVQKIRPDAVKKEIDALRAKSNVVVDEAFFKPGGAVTN